ncbi:hypothetical protein F383_25375 [Gossypium arboreum]|uniref:Uncharacterized protein n=1 Tax=Gossypium arboreum TaxID=29729 RepID=A0A0B0P4Q4_GOSAR|nr:hypothetical protein F383_25375 [Gossypium arboreum]
MIYNQYQTNLLTSFQLYIKLIHT